MASFPILKSMKQAIKLLMWLSYHVFKRRGINEYQQENCISNIDEHHIKPLNCFCSIMAHRSKIISTTTIQSKHKLVSTSTRNNEPTDHRPERCVDTSLKKMPKENKGYVKK